MSRLSIVALLTCCAQQAPPAAERSVEGIDLIGTLHEDVCGSAEMAFIGQVVRADPYLAPSGAREGFIWSTLTLSVERNLFGVPGPEFTVDQPGGDLDGEWTRGSHGIQPDLGGRWLVVARTLQEGDPQPGGWHYPGPGEPHVFTAVEIDPRAEMPSATELLAQWEAHCP